MEDYNDHHKTLTKFKIKNINDIILPSNPNLIQSYNNFSINNNKTKMLIKTFNGEIPKFYETIIKTFANKESTTRRLKNINNHFTLNKSLNSHQQQEPEITWPNEVHIWTDGSYKKNPTKLGAACIIINSHTNEKIGEIKSSLSEINYPSSTKAELHICTIYIT
jgi:hypothetical protein